MASNRNNSRTNSKGASRGKGTNPKGASRGKGTSKAGSRAASKATTTKKKPAKKGSPETGVKDTKPNKYLRTGSVTGHGVGLTPKRLLFVKEYVKDFNGSQAAIRAGYAPRSAGVEGARLLADAKVAASIREEVRKLIGRVELEAEDIVEELARVGFADLEDFAEWDTGGLKLKPSKREMTPEGMKALPKGAGRAIQEIKETRNNSGTTLSIKLHDKLSALNMLGKYKKMFTDKVEVSGGFSLEERPGIDWSKLNVQEQAILRKALQTSEQD